MKIDIEKIYADMILFKYMFFLLLINIVEITSLYSLFMKVMHKTLKSKTHSIKYNNTS